MHDHRLQALILQVPAMNASNGATISPFEWVPNLPGGSSLSLGLRIGLTVKIEVELITGAVTVMNRPVLDRLHAHLPFQFMPPLLLSAAANGMSTVSLRNAHRKSALQPRWLRL